MTLATICSGIGAPEVALHALGWRSLWVAQHDPEHDYSRGPDFPSAVLTHRFPGLHNYGDLTKIPADAPTPDVLIGGTPCQAFSVAGLRGGLADPRGGLTLAFVTLVGILRPRWIVWENVPGVLSSDGGSAFGSLLSGLGLLGYGWAYRVLDAQYFGLAQRRKRVFVVAYSGGDWRRAGAVLFEPEGVCWDSPPRREEGEGVAGALAASTGGSDENDARDGRLVALDGGTCARSLNAHSGRYDYETESLVIAHTLRGEGHDASEDGTGRGSPLVFDTTQITSAANRCNPQAGDPCHPLAGSAHPSLVCWTGEDQVADPISASEGKTYSHEGSNFRLHNCVDQRSGIRRLTPREMERLQGFSDDFTAIPWRNKSAKECPDGPRAKALGNSMAVPVLRWLGRRIEAVDGL